MPLPSHLVLKKARRDTIASPLATPVIPGEFFRDSIPSLHEDPFIPTQLRVSSLHTLTTLLPLDNLTYLDLSYNDWLTDIPPQLLRSTSLRKLDISGCVNLRDGVLPGCLGQLQNLEWLAADGCNIISIDFEISSLKKLHTLSVKYNQLDYLPPHLARLYPNLKLIALEGNPCYDAYLPRLHPPTPIEPTPPPVTPTPSRPSSRNLPSFPRLRHAKSVPNVRARSRTVNGSSIPTPEKRQQSPENPRKSFFRQITPPLPSFIHRRPPRPDAKQARETAEVIGIAQESQWPVGPSPESLVRKKEGDRTSESSCEESDSYSHSSFESSPASSISSPFHGNKIPLVGIDDVTVDEKALTVRVLSRLRDLYELANGWVCLDDNYTPAPVGGESDEVEGLGIQMGNLSPGDNKESVNVVKKIMGQNNVKRSNIVREIIETEESYIRGIQELVDIYIDNIVPPHAPVEDSRVIFRHVKILLNFHKNFFLPALVEVTDPSRYAGHSDPTSMTCDAVAAVFEENVDFMKMYFEYINNFDEAVRIVEKWQTKEDGNSAGSRFLKARAQDERHSQLNLLGYLLLPVQRVPRYKLLLADLVASTNAPSTRLRAGYEKIECLARDINDRKAEMEGRKRLVQLERTVVCPPGVMEEYEGRLSSTSKFVDPARRLVKEEFVHVIVRRKKVAGGLTWEKQLEQKCLAISCSDKLFLCTSSQEILGQPPSLSLLAEIPLENAVATRCWESPTEWRLMVFDPPSFSPPSPGGTLQQIGGESWRFKCNKEDDIPDWLDAISKATKRSDLIGKSDV